MKEKGKIHLFTAIPFISTIPRKLFHRRFFNHSIYDWLNLFSNLLVPIAIGILTIVLPLQQDNLNEKQNEHSYQISFTNRLRNLQAVHDQQKQMILNQYQQDLTDLMLKYDSSLNSTDVNDDDDDERISLVIRTKTLHALRQLDPARKIFLIQLLIDSGIQHRINISHTDLSSLIFPPGSFYSHLRMINIIAKNLTLKSIFLYRSNFSYSNFDDSTFQDSNCSHADFSYTSLQRTNWINTDATQVMFNYTNLFEANITNEQLIKARSLLGATLPNGTVIPN